MEDAIEGREMKKIFKIKNTRKSIVENIQVCIWI